MTAAVKETHGADEDPRVQTAMAQLNGLLVPGESTTCVWNRIPCSANPRSWGMMSGAVGLRSR